MRRRPDLSDCEGFKYWIEPDQGTAVIYGRAAGNADTEVSIPNEVTYDGENYDVTKINNARTILYLLLLCHGKIGQTDVNMTRKRCDR